MCTATNMTTGGIIGSLVFRSQDAPNYLPGIYACIASQAIGLALILSMGYHFHCANKKQAAGQLVLENDVDFRYTI